MFLIPTKNFLFSMNSDFKFVEDCLKKLVEVNTVNSSNSSDFFSVFEDFLNKNSSLPFEIVEVNKEGVLNRAYFFPSPNSNLKEWIVLDSHYDVVDGEKELFSPFIKYEGGKPFLYGRGSNDNKFGLVVMLLLSKQLKEINKNICFFVVGDEEKGGRNGTLALLSKVDKILKERHQKIGEALVLEPIIQGSLLEKIKVGVRGVLRVNIRVKGRNFKASQPLPTQQGFVHGFLKFLLDEAEKCDKEEAFFSSKNIISLNGKFVLRVVGIKTPYDRFRVVDEGEVNLYIRYPPTIKKEEVLEWLKVKGEEFGVKVIIKSFEGYEGFVCNNHPRENIFFSALKEFNPYPKKTIEGGGSNAIHYNSFNIPVFEFGVTLYNAHLKDEKVDLSEIVRLSSFIHKYLKL